MFLKFDLLPPSQLRRSDIKPHRTSHELVCFNHTTYPNDLQNSQDAREMVDEPTSEYSRLSASNQLPNIVTYGTKRTR